LGFFLEPGGLAAPLELSIGRHIMHPSETMKEEHQVILKVLSAVEKFDRYVAAAGNFPGDQVERVLEFARMYADRFHHCKEEDCLFPVLERRGMVREKGPIGTLLHDHQRARKMIASIGEILPHALEGNGEAQKIVMNILMHYVDHLRHHIKKEDADVFAQGDGLLTADDQLKLEKDFVAAENADLGAGAGEKYCRMAEELEAAAESLQQA